MSPSREEISGSKLLELEENETTLFQSITESGPNQVNLQDITEIIEALDTYVAVLQMQAGVNPRRKRRTDTVNPDQTRATLSGAVHRGDPYDTEIFRQLPPPPPLTAALHGTLASIALADPLYPSLAALPALLSLLESRQGTSSCSRLERQVTIPLSEHPPIMVFVEISKPHIRVLWVAEYVVPSFTRSYPEDRKVLAFSRDVS